MNIKKITASLLAAVMLTCSAAVSVPASAVNVTDGILDEETNLFYVPLKDGTLQVTTFDRGTEPTGDIVIPEMYNGKTVSEVKNILTDCLSVTSVTIPKTVTKIGFSSFSYGSKLENVIVSEENANFCSKDGVLFNKDKTEIIYYPRGKSEASYTIPSTVDIIGSRCFIMSELESIIIPDSVSVIEDQAFGMCDKLTSLNIPEGVEKIDGSISAFSGIAEFAVASNNEFFCAVDGVIFSKDSKTLVAYPSGKKAEEYSVPSGTEVWGQCSLSYNIDLKKINMPESVYAIEDKAFCHCELLTQIEVPNKVKRIQRGSFEACSHLESVTLPLGIEKIEIWAFYNCRSLATINFRGTKADWDMIEIDLGNTAMNNAVIKFFDGTTMNGAGLVEETNQAPETKTNEDGSKDFTPGVKREGAVSNADFETMKQIKASAPNGTFKEEVTMNVSRDTASLGGRSFAVDIIFTNASGDEVQPEKDVTVKIPVPARLQNAKKIFVYHINSEKKPEKIEAAIENIDGVSYVVFSAKQFSVYELTDKEVETTTPEVPDDPESPDDSDSGSGSGTTTPSTSSTPSTSDTSSSEPTSSDTSSEPASSVPGYIERETSVPDASSTVPTNTESNPSTGVAMSVLPIVAAISAVIVIKKKK